MKRTLALLIAVLMVVALLPLSTFAAAGQANAGATAPQGNQATTQATPDAQQTPPAPTSNDYFAVYDANGAWVGYYATLAEADAALEDGATLKILQSYTADATYTFGAARADKDAPIRYTVDGALAQGGNAVVTVNAALGWCFDGLSVGDDVVLKNVTVIAAESAVKADAAMNLTLENCKLYAGNSYAEVNAQAYAEAPAANEGVALDAKGVALSVLGKDTVLRATNGAALQAVACTVFVENGYFYSSAAAKTVVLNESKLSLSDAVIVNNVQSALWIEGGVAYIHGGEFAVTAADGTVDAAALFVTNSAAALMTGGMLVAGENAYAIVADEFSGVAVCNADVAVANPENTSKGFVWNMLSDDEMEITITEVAAEVSIVGEGTVEAPAHKIAVNLEAQIRIPAVPADMQTSFRLYNANGDLIAYEKMDKMTNEDLAVMVELTPNGGKLVLDTDFVVNNAFEVASGFPKMAITIEGGSAAPAKISGAVNGYLLTVSNSMEITLKNVTVENTVGSGVKVAKNASLVLDENAAVVAFLGDAVCVADTANVKVEKGATVKSNHLNVGESATVILEGGAAFELNGGDVVSPKTKGASAFLSVAATYTVAEYSYTLSNVTLRLTAGTVTLPGTLSTLHQLTGETADVDVTLATAVTLKGVDGGESFQFNNSENAVELLDNKGDRVGVYGSIAVALADVKDGYTVKLLADHVEVGVIKTAFEEIKWSFNGGNKALYVPEFAANAMEFAGKNTVASLENIILFAGANGISVNPATKADGVGVIASNVFVYFGGASQNDATAYMGDVSNIAGFRVENAGGELILLGDASGAYMNAQYATSTRLVYNGGFLSIYGGKFEAPVARLVETFSSNAMTYIAGGEFILSGDYGVAFYNRASGKTTLTGGTVIAKSGSVFEASSGAITVYGGDYYHLSDVAFTANTTTRSYTTYYGGNFYEDCDVTASMSFTAGMKLTTGRQLCENAESYATGDKEKVYGIDANTALTRQTFEDNEIWLDVNGLVKGEYLFMAYTGNGDTAIGIYRASDFALATQIVGTYNGKIEVQKNIDIQHTARIDSRQFGPIAEITLTSKSGEHFTYASSNYNGASNGSVYFLWFNGGNWRIEDLTIANYGSQLLQVNSNSLSRTTVIVGEGGELSGHTSVVLLNHGTRLIVEEGGYCNVSKNANPKAGVTVRDHLPASSNIVRIEGGADVYVYGYLGFYPADAEHTEPYLPDNGAFRCINYNGSSSYIAGTGEQCTIYLGSTAMLGSPIGAKKDALINLNISITAEDALRDILVQGEPGATFVTDGYVVNANAGAQLMMDGVKIQSATESLDGSFVGGSGTYAFVMNGAGGVFKNITYFGSNFMSISSAGLPKQDALNITFEGDNKIIGKSTAILWSVAATCNTNLVINDGYYQSQAGNFFSSAADATAEDVAQGKLTVNGGTFYKDNGNNYTMFLSYGSYDIIINDGFFHNAYNALIFSMANSSGKAVCTTELTINGGEFELWHGWLYSDEASTNETKLTINDCHVMAESGTDYENKAVSATGIMRIGGKCEAVINGGVFETEEFATNKTCDIIQSRHTANVTINDWTVYHRAGNESAIRVMGDSNVTVNGGWIESNGRFVVRTMGGANTATALTTPSKAILTVYGGTMILNPSHPKLSTSTSNCVIGNGGSEQFGHVYIWGGQFINKNDADRIVPDSSYSRQVLGQINSFGDFEIHGGIMIATAAQDYFYSVENNAVGDGISIPTVSLAIVKGVTPKYVGADGRTYYYAVYGMGTSLLVPEIQTAFEADVTESGTGIIFTAEMAAVHYDALITWARAHADDFNGNEQDYVLSFGMLITTVDGVRASMGRVDIAALESVGAVCLIKPADAADAVMNADGTLDFSATVDHIVEENKTVQYLAIPYVDLTVGAKTTNAVTTRYYGEYNTNAGVASMASVAASLLRDNSDVVTGDYQYPSVMMSNAYNRYTVAQQSVLMTYLAHEHNFDYKGVCQDAACNENVAIDLQGGAVEQIYAESDTVKFYKLSLEMGVSYSIGFTKDVVSYVMYDADGNVCEVVGGVFAPDADGEYYIRVNGKRIGSTQLIVSHIHDADYLGFCAVCGETLAQPLQLENTDKQLVVKHNFYYYSIDLENNINYSFALVNGDFRLYDAAGNEQELTDNMFVCTETATYYIEVEATYTAMASICVAHVHNYNTQGICAVDGCDSDIGVSVSGVYKYTTATQAIKGEKLFYNIKLMAGQTYSVFSNRYVGIMTFHDATGAQLPFDNDTYTCTEDGTYYLVVDVQATVTNVQFCFEMEHGEECSYNNKGECEFIHVNSEGVLEKVSCGKTDRNRLYDDAAGQSLSMEAGKSYYFYFNYAGKDITYMIDMPAQGVEYRLCDADGNIIKNDEDEGILYTFGEEDSNGRKVDLYKNSAADGLLYLVVTSTATEEQFVKIAVSHVHDVKYTGSCDVMDTTRDQVCPLNNCQSLEADRSSTVNFQAGNTYYFEMDLRSGVEYKILFTNASALTWTIKDAQGVTQMTDENGNAFTPNANGYYYLIVTPAANSGENAAIKLESHTHTINNKGECACGFKKLNFIINLDQLAANGGLLTGRLVAGKYYLPATMEAGKTYTLKLQSQSAVKLYGGANADVEKVMIDGAFTCDASGVYYYVIDITRATMASHTIAYTITPDLPVAHEHAYTSAYRYEKVDGKYYQVYDTCDEATCDLGKRVEVTALEVGTAVTIRYENRESYYYAIELVAGKQYSFDFVNSTATWSLVTADGAVVATNEDGIYLATEDGAYYLEVVATADSEDKHGAKASLTVTEQ